MIPTTYMRAVYVSVVVFSELVCDLLPFAKGALHEEYLRHNFDEQCLGGH